MSERQIEQLTETETEYLQTPVKELRDRGLLHSALQAMQRKFEINRFENGGERNE